MEKENKKEELQTRREFFKKAAKMALPILGAVVLSGMPEITAKAETEKTGCDGCAYSCYGTCRTYCEGCIGGCKGTCQGSCVNNGCAGSCHYSCTGISY